MPPVMQVFSADKLGIVISCGHVSGLDQAAFHEPRACMEIGGSSPNQKCELVGSLSHVWMPPVMQVFSADKLGIVISCGHVSGLDEAAFHEPRACMEIGGSSPNQKCELVGSLSHAGCFDPVLLTVFPYLFCEFLTSSTSSGGWSVV